MLVAAVVLLAMVLAAPVQARKPTHPRIPAVDLTTYGYGNGRLGASLIPVGISPSQASGLYTAWRQTLPGGAVDGQALVVNGIKVSRHQIRTVVYVGTEHGWVVAVVAGSGRILWKRFIGAASISPSCQASPDGVFGITGTMVIDKSTGRLYAVDVSGLAWAFDITTGRLVRGWPVRVHPPGADFNWGALAISRGWLYVPIASLCDRGFYYGGIKEVDLAHPHVIRQWETTAHTSSWGGGIWGWGGESIDGATGDVFVATGNSLGTSNEADGNAESVVRLSSLLKFEQANYPLRSPFQTTDRDFGTAPVLFRPGGCPLQAAVIQKDGWLYRYNADHIDSGPRQAIQVGNTVAHGIPLYGMPAYDPASRTLVLTSPSNSPDGSERMGIQTYVVEHNCNLIGSWQQGFDPPAAGSPPTIAQGVLYIGTGRNGLVRAYRLSDGQQLWVGGLGSTSFAAPSVSDGMVFVGDWNSDLWAFRAPR